MLPLAADENFDNGILRGLRQRRPDLDVVRVQDVGLSGADDPAILAWAAREGRVLLTHDIRTMPRYAYERVQAGQLMPGIFVLAADTLIGQAIEELLLLVEGSLAGEWDGQVLYLPLR